MNKKEDFSDDSTPVPKSEFDRITTVQHILMTGVIIVLFVGFTALMVAIVAPIIDAIRFRGDTYGDLRDKVVASNTKTDTATKEVEKINIEIQLLKEELKTSQEQNKALCKRLGISC